MMFRVGDHVRVLKYANPKRQSEREYIKGLICKSRLKVTKVLKGNSVELNHRYIVKNEYLKKEK